MWKTDVLLIGAGPAALSALAGLAGKGLDVIQLSGAAGRCIGASSWVQGGLRRPSVGEELGLPEVRAFGVGGTTQLWHGGLFAPSVLDEVVSVQDGISNGSDLLGHLNSMLARAEGVQGELFDGLRRVISFCEKNESGRTAVRGMYVPTVRPQITASMFEAVGAALRSFTLLDDWAVDIVDTGSGFDVLCAGPDRMQVIHSRHLVLAAGVLGSAVLVRRLLKMPRLHFSDHYHVFGGVVSSRSVDRLFNESPASKNGFRPSLKFSVTLTDGDAVDVGFSFRRVSNPDFPRSGRRFGRFVGVNALSRREKLELVLKNPMTGIEMLAYRWGVQLPLSSSLVHCTVSPQRRVGTIDEAGVTPNTPRALIAAAIRKAWPMLLMQLGEHGSEARLFDEVQIGSSAISGAQFVGSLTDEAVTSHGLMRKILVADCSRFKFTSVYNQGMVSLAAGFAAVARQL